MEEEQVMSRYALIPSRRIVILFPLLAGFALATNAATDVRVSESYGKLPLHFEANRGQTDNDVHFLSRGAGYSLYLTASEAVLVLAKPDAKGDGRTTRERRNTPTRAQSVALRMSLVGAARKPAVTGVDELPGKANYFIGKDPAKWRTDVPTYAKVHYRDVYPGIDLVYYGNQRRLEHDFIVSPGADPNKIVLDFKGAERLEIDAQGNLVLHTAAGVVLQRKPVIYQEIEGVRTAIAGSYTLRSARRAGFKLAAYDTTRPLVIDPILLYSTFLGGNGGDSGRGIAADADGNAYVIGNTSSTDFPTTAGTFRTSPSTCSLTPTVFVTKLNPTGSALVYSSYLGGCNDLGGAIAVDAAGNAYLTGTTRSFGFPTTTGAFQRSTDGASAFVTKISPTGSELVYSTFLGGRFDDTGSGIAIDSAGNAYVAGWTQSIDFPTTPGAFQPVYSGGGGEAAFATKLNPEGSALVYSTYLSGGGGSGHDQATGIAVDADGNAYVVGSSSPFAGRPATFPTTAGALQPVFGGGFADAFVAKLDATGSALVYSTFLGGSQSEGASSIVVDAAGNAYVSGGTRSTDFPTTAGAFQTILRGTSDAFVTKLNPAGSALVYSTFLGGGGDDAGNIAVDADGNAYLAGSTTSTDFPTTADAFQARLAGGQNAFVAKLDPTGSALSYSTYLGGTVGDSGTGIAVDTHGNAYVTGVAQSSDFPTTPGAFQRNHGSGSDRVGNPNPDAFVAKFVSSARFEESAATQIGFWTSYGAETGSFSGGSIVASNVVSSTAMFSFTGAAVSWIGVKCNVCGIAAVSIDGGAPTMVDTAGPGAPGSLSSEAVFSASGLAATSHMITITVTGTTSSGGAYVAVDAFDLTSGGATPPLLPPVVLPQPPVTPPPLPPIPGL
jgi:hypothetical protein